MVKRHKPIKLRLVTRGYRYQRGRYTPHNRNARDYLFFRVSFLARCFNGARWSWYFEANSLRRFRKNMGKHPIRSDANQREANMEKPVRLRRWIPRR